MVHRHASLFDRNHWLLQAPIGLQSLVITAQSYLPQAESTHAQTARTKTRVCKALPDESQGTDALLATTWILKPLTHGML
jgi:hypothetical protein